MISIVNVIFILLIHFVADFLCQSRQMATNKSKSLYWLSLHVMVYTLTTFVGWALLFSINSDYPNKDIEDLVLRVFVIIWNYGLPILLITYITHWVTDFITSKLTTYFYTKEKYFEFFGVIGLDQLIHATTLFLTYGYLFN